MLQVALELRREHIMLRAIKITPQIVVIIVVQIEVIIIAVVEEVLEDNVKCNVISSLNRR